MPDNISTGKRREPVKRTFTVELPDEADAVYVFRLPMVAVKCRVELLVEVRNYTACNGHRKPDNIEKMKNLFFIMLRQVIKR